MSRKKRYGVGRITAAAIGAPSAAMLVAVALPTAVPASSDLRYLVACLSLIPLMTAAPILALLARSAGRAWTGIGVVSVAALLLIWKGV